MHRTICLATVTYAMFAMSADGADVKGSSDHPLFPNRMPGFSISAYSQRAYTVYQFHTRPPKDVEGKHTRISYFLNRGQEHPGGVAIRRNYENAVKQIGGEIVFTNSNLIVMKVKFDGRETWVELACTEKNTGPIYRLNIVEMTEMVQVITADAMAAELNKAGFIALDVRFATAKADILPESQALIEQMAEMMRKNTGLRVGVEGHTDNTGTPATNMALSTARAKSVTAALVAAGIAAGRLTPAGFGETRPVADNRTEEGRAKNRRVELVKK